MSSFKYNTIEPEDLPMPSASMIKLVELCLDDDVDIDLLAKEIIQNPVITTRLLTVANSPYYGFSKKIDSIAHAVVAMGLTHIKSMVLCIAVKESLSDKIKTDLDIEVFWKESVIRAVACEAWLDELSSGQIHEKSQAFTAGLFADIGRLVLFIFNPDKLERWNIFQSQPPNERLLMEEAVFGQHHAELSSQFILQWQLPKVFYEAIKEHHDDCPKTLIGKALKLADWSCAIFLGYDKANILPKFYQMVESLTKTNKEETQKLLQTMVDKFQAAAQMFDIKSTVETNLSDIFNLANIQLAQENITYQEVTWQLQHALDIRDQYAIKLDEELEVAREIQKSLQPDVLKFPNVAAFNLPAKTLSGDFFDYFPGENNSFNFAIGDVSGKGTHAALIMAKTISLFRCLAKVETDLTKILSIINEELCETTTKGMFVTFIGGRFHRNTDEIELVNAGHVPPLIIQNAKIKALNAKSPPLGVSENVSYEVDRFRFKNARMFLLSDGLTEAKLKGGEMAGVKGVLQWVLKTMNEDIQKQLMLVQSIIEDKTMGQDDDMTMLIISN